MKKYKIDGLHIALAFLLGVSSAGTVYAKRITELHRRAYHITLSGMAPAAVKCDEAKEIKREHIDTAADEKYFCAGVSGWRKITSTVP